MEINNINKTIAGKIKKLRKKRGLTQKELSKLCGISPNCISEFESAKHKPGIITLIKMANVIGVSIDYLVGISPNENKANSQIGKTLGLNDNAISFLTTLVTLDNEKSKNILNVINCILDVDNINRTMNYLQSVFAFLNAETDE